MTGAIGKANRSVDVGASMSKHSTNAVIGSLAVMLALGGCAGTTTGNPESNVAEGATQPGAKLDRVALGKLAQAAKDDPKDVTAALRHARAVRTLDGKPQALAVVERSARTNSDNRFLQREIGLLALEIGQLAKAEAALSKSLDPKVPDWQTHLALGTALASSGKRKDADAHFKTALQLQPNHPSILNNMALSLALDGKASEAEKVLRTAAQPDGTAPQVKQNLALVLAISGKYKDAEKVAATVLAKDAASANIAMVRKMRPASGTATAAVAPPPTVPVAVPTAATDPLIEGSRRSGLGAGDLR